MLTLYHAPQSRSSRIIRLIDELGAFDQITIETVGIRRMLTGTGARDPRNPHPEGKVPLLVHDGVVIRESNAIMLYLTELFPEAGLGLPVGHPERGALLSWMAWYGNIMEPVFIAAMAGVDHPMLHSAFRGVPELTARLTEGLEGRDYLVAGRYTIADLICHAVFAWKPDSAPDVPVIRDWIARCMARPTSARAAAFDVLEQAA
jgi:glutathione S-transferase